MSTTWILASLSSNTIFRTSNWWIFLLTCFEEIWLDWNFIFSTVNCIENDTDNRGGPGLPTTVFSELWSGKIQWQVLNKIRATWILYVGPSKFSALSDFLLATYIAKFLMIMFGHSKQMSRSLISYHFWPPSNSQMVLYSNKPFMFTIQQAICYHSLVSIAYFAYW